MRTKGNEQIIDRLTKRQAQNQVWDRTVEVNNCRIELEDCQAKGLWDGNFKWELQNTQEMLEEVQDFLARFA